MEKVVVLGCGYIGTNIAQYINKNYKNTCEVIVIGIDNDYRKFLDKDIKFVSLNINDIKEDDSSIFKNGIIIDCIGNMNATTESSDLMFLEEAKSKIKLMNRIECFGIKKYIFLSSGGTIYGDSNEKHKEDNVSSPLNVYALEKFIEENYLKINFSENNKLDYLIVRISNPYGGYVLPSKKQGIVDVSINKLLNDEEITFFGDLDNIRDYIYIDNVSEIIYRLLMKNAKAGIYNIGSGKGHSIKEVFDTIEKVFDKKISLNYQNLNTQNINCNILDISKLANEIELPELLSLEEGIKKIYKIKNKK